MQRIIHEAHMKPTPQNRDVTYASFVLDYRPLKSEPNCVHITVGGDRLTYNSDSGSPAANLLKTKLLINSTISDASRGARFVSADLKDFFLATPMEGDKFMKVKYKHFPDDIHKRYNLDKKSNKGWTCFHPHQTWNVQPEAGRSLRLQPLTRKLASVRLQTYCRNSGTLGTRHSSKKNLRLR